MHCERRFLKLEILASDDFGDKARLRVLEQTHTGDDFAFVPADALELDEVYGPDTTQDSFEASNRYTLLSRHCPEWSDEDKRLYVQGYDDEENDNTLEVPMEDVVDIIAAVREYNQTHSMDEEVEPPPEPKLMQTVQFIVQ